MSVTPNHSAFRITGAARTARWPITSTHATNIVPDGLDGSLGLADTDTLRLRRDTPLTVGDNESYTGHLPGDTIDRHAPTFGRPNVLIELRQNLIVTQPEQDSWAAKLAPILTETLKDTGL